MGIERRGDDEYSLLEKVAFLLTVFVLLFSPFFFSPSLQPRPTPLYLPFALSSQHHSLPFYTRYPIPSSRPLDLYSPIFAILFTKLASLFLTNSAVLSTDSSSPSSSASGASAEEAENLGADDYLKLVEADVAVEKKH